MTVISSPTTKQELLKRAESLAGLTFAEVAEGLNIAVPLDLKRHKGWVGNLMELALGAKAGSKPEQDFQHLGIELKTLPVSITGKVLETTFVSLAPLTQTTGVAWDSSHVRYKLSSVLWIPVEGERSIPLRERRIGMPILWQPSPQQEEALRQDWEELMEDIIFGRFEEINARKGIYLQLRPKGANRLSRTEGVNALGQKIRTLPLGFYLRKNFTQQIIEQFLQTRGE